MNENVISFENEEHALRNFKTNYLNLKTCKGFKTDKQNGMYFIVFVDDETHEHVEKQFCFSGGEFGCGWSKTIRTPLKTLAEKAEELYQKLVEGAIDNF